MLLVQLGGDRGKTGATPPFLSTCDRPFFTIFHKTSSGPSICAQAPQTLPEGAL
jgi:hypothetical protein